jgi:hypothetical protein
MTEGASALPWGVGVHLTRRPGPPSTHPFRSDDRGRALARGGMPALGHRPEGQTMPRAGAEPGAPSPAAPARPLGPGLGLALRGACSSAGQSARLISVRSAVQIGPGPPIQMTDVR